MSAGDGLEAAVTAVPGIGPVRGRQLARLGIETVGQLLRRPPRDYIDARRHAVVSELQEGRLVSVSGIVTNSRWQRSRRDRSLWIGTVVLRDDEGESVDLVSFARTRGGRRPHPLTAVDERRRFVASGIPRRTRNGRWQMHSFAMEAADKSSLHTGRIVPVYSLTEGLSQKIMRRLVRAALDAAAEGAADVVPRRMLAEARLPRLRDALEQLHYPGDWQELHRARQRLALEELLLLRLAASARRRVGSSAPRGVSLPPAEPSFLKNLPFALTRAQQRVLDEVAADLAGSRPMQRLLQGDVGSGKTVVAAYAAFVAAAAGGQAALLAPSDVLVRQHARTLRRWFGPDGIRIATLRGATKPEARDDVLQRLAAGEPMIVVGTHALLQPDVRFRRLAVVVVDEQHRFGVEQRQRLLRRNPPPHVLVVSATPIPRTLAHCIYGDLDVSTIDEMPPGRLPVDTRWLRPSRRDEVYAFVRKQAEAGNQAYIVFPAIGDDGNVDREVDAGGDDDQQLLHRARALAEGPLSGLRTEIVHGRQREEEQFAAFARFREGEADVLLATSVIEVGVDVPRASVIVIEGADKFGLAQLHQLRGRVGRGGGRSYCFLLAEPSTDGGRRRLEALRGTNDGFALAQKDLALRGPGELLGLRQSGLPDLSPLGQQADARTLQLVDGWSERLLAVPPADRPPEKERLWVAVTALTDSGRTAPTGV